MDNNEIKPLPAAFITKTSANQRISAYQNHKLPGLTSALGKDDTCSIWYAMEHLEQLMDELRYQQASGMRIYFGAYPSNHPDYSGQLCLVMIPTVNGTTMGHHPDLIIEEQADFTDRFGIFDPEAIDDIYKSFNFGSPCPPACLSGDNAFPE